MDPPPRSVRRMIDDSLETETKGLSGAAYFDARWPRPEPGKKVEGYAFYDQALHLAADYLRKQKRMKVVLDEGEASCLPPGSVLMLPCIADGTAWENMWMPFNGKKVRLRITSQAQNVSTCEILEVRSGASACWKRVLLPAWGLPVSPMSRRFPCPIFFSGFLRMGI